MSNLKVSESFIIGIDITQEDEAMVQVARRIGPTRLDVINTFKGEEAKVLYSLLTNKNIEGRK